MARITTTSNYNKVRVTGLLVEDDVGETDNGAKKLYSEFSFMFLASSFASMPAVTELSC